MDLAAQGRYSYTPSTPSMPQQALLGRRLVANINLRFALFCRMQSYSII